MATDPFLSIRQRFLNAALSALGQPYVWGGNYLWKGVDCSGLVAQALLAAGYQPPRTAAAQSAWAQRINPNEAVAGDLVYWDTVGQTDRTRGADHTGIYLGNGMVLEASSGQNKVVVRKLWGNYRFGRVIGTKEVSPSPYGIRLGSSGVTIDKLSQLGGQLIAPPPASGVEVSTDPYAVAAAAGTGVGPAAAPRLAPNATEAQIIAFIEENYGPAQIALLKVPELRTALITAAQNGMVGDRFMVEVEKTTWWKSRTESMRTWDLLELTSPKDAADRLAKRKAQLAGTWESYGVDGDIDEMAKQIERLQLNEAQVNQKVAAALSAESESTGLDRGTTGSVSADELMRIARMEYLTPVDRQTVERWAIRAIRTGEDVEGAWRQFLAGLAGPRFGIDQAAGVAPADVMAPVKMAIAESLEISPDEIDLLDSRYSSVLQVETADGRYRPMTQHEATVWARSQDEYKTTKGAQDRAASIAEGLAQSFGKVAS